MDLKRRIWDNDKDYADDYDDYDNFDGNDGDNFDGNDGDIHTISLVLLLKFSIAMAVWTIFRITIMRREIIITPRVATY